MSNNGVILIMEDMPFWSLMLKRELEKFNIKGDEVRNGMLGVEKIQKGKERYSAVITDVQMPVMDGIEATRQIRALGFTRPILGFSSLDAKEDIAKALEAGMDGYFVKGINFEGLERILKQVGIL